MSAPAFAANLGPGQWVGKVYVVERCLLWGGIATLKFGQRGNWVCAGCNVIEPMPLEAFRNRLAASPLYAAIADSMMDPVPPKGLILVSKYRPAIDPYCLGSGIGPMDAMTGGMRQGSLIVGTGRRGHGKSTLLGQITLNAIQNGTRVCFYSGELDADMFQEWIFSQAAGTGFMESYVDKFGATRWRAQGYAAERIRTWIGDSLAVYDNTDNDSSERNSILERFRRAREYWGSSLFVVDNLMTAKYDQDNEKNYVRAQANFAGQLLDFARVTQSVVILVAHPRKGQADENRDDDPNDLVAGSGDITNLASTVFMIKIANERERDKFGCDTLLHLTKNRRYGEVGAIRLNYDKICRRLVAVDGDNINKYGWEDLC